MTHRDGFPRFSARRSTISASCTTSRAIWTGPSGSTAAPWWSSSALGPQHPDLADTLDNYADILSVTGRRTEAAGSSSAPRESGPRR
ncbi:MAG: hypothetical protein V3U23_00040, partial [Kiloniellales bacterium]